MAGEVLGDALEEQRVGAELASFAGEVGADAERDLSIACEGAALADTHDALAEQGGQDA